MKRIPFARIKDKNKYFTRKLKEGCIIVDVVISDTEKEIRLLSAYGNDQEDKSCMACMYPEIYRESVFVTQVIPNYPFKDETCSDVHMCCVEPFDMSHGIFSFEMVACHLSYLVEKYAEQVYYMDDDENPYHREFYIFKPDLDYPYNMASLGTEFESAFIEEWMKSNGYYIEQ